MTDHDHKQYVPGCYRCDLGKDEERESMLDELDAARAEVERLRGMLALLCAAVEHSAPGYGVYEDWGDICDAEFLALRERMIEAKALLAKHKETNQ